jgi:streptogramin lyase
MSYQFSPLQSFVVQAAMVLGFGSTGFQVGFAQEPAASAPAAPQPSFDAPESAYWYAAGKHWFVSSSGGQEVKKDGIGWVTKVDENGKPMGAKFVEGLNSPHGMVVVKDKLYIADTDVLHEINAQTGEKIAAHPLPECKYANDVTADSKGLIFISDFKGNKIYTFDTTNQKAQVWLESEELEQPNGLFVQGGQLIVGTWGPIKDWNTYESSHPGSLKSIDIKTKKMKMIPGGQRIGNLDGVVKVGEAFYVSDFMSGSVLKVHSGKKQVVLSDIVGIADIGYSRDTKTILLPVYTNNTIFRMFAE